MKNYNGKEKKKDKNKKKLKKNKNRIFNGNREERKKEIKRDTWLEMRKREKEPKQSLHIIISYYNIILYIVRVVSRDDGTPTASPWEPPPKERRICVATMSSE